MSGDGWNRAGWCERLYRAKAPELMLYGRALGLSRAEAEDVLQDVFVELLALGGEPKDGARYCVRSYRNRAFNLRRGWWRRIRRELESVSWFERDGTEHPAERAAMRCLERLPVEQREVIVLKIWHGYTLEEVGEISGVSPNTAAGRYRYGLRRIRQLLSEYECGESLGEAASVLGAARPLACP